MTPRDRAERGLGMTPRERQMLGFLVARQRSGMSWTYEQAKQRLGCRSKGQPFFLITQLAERAYLIRHASGEVELLPAAYAAFPVVQVRAFTGGLRRCEPDGTWPYRGHRTMAEVWASEARA